MTVPRFSALGNCAVLRCPRCRGDFDHLHQGRVEVFERREDAERVCRTTVDRKTTDLDYLPNDESGNPSSRRQGLRIHFECEGCGDGLILNIGQHKGQTLVDWTIGPPSEGWS